MAAARGLGMAGLSAAAAGALLPPPVVANCKPWQEQQRRHQHSRPVAAPWKKYEGYEDGRRSVDRWEHLPEVYVEREDEDLRAAGPAVAGKGHSAAHKAEQAAAAPSPPSELSAPGGSQTCQTRVLDMLGSMQTQISSVQTQMGSMQTRMDTRMGSMETRMDSLDTRMGSMEEQNGEMQKKLGNLEGLSDSVGHMGERLVRMERFVVGEDELYRKAVLMKSVADVLRACSTPDFPACEQRLLDVLLNGDCAYTALRRLVVKQLQKEASERGVQLPKFFEAVDSWPTEKEHWQQAKKALLAARQKRSGKVAWLPAAKGLLAYSSAAAHSRLPSYLLAPEQGQLVLMLLAALAAKQQLEVLDFDSVPLLKVQPTEQGTTLLLDLLEIKSRPSDIGKAAGQLEARARIMAFVLATANAALLAAHGPLQVVGTVEVAGKASSPGQCKDWAGKRRKLGCTVAPETAQMFMQLRVRH